MLHASQLLHALPGCHSTPKALGPLENQSVLSTAKPAQMLIVLTIRKLITAKFHCLHCLSLRDGDQGQGLHGCWLVQSRGPVTFLLALGGGAGGPGSDFAGGKPLGTGMCGPN